MSRTLQPSAGELRLPAHLSELADDEEFREELLEIARTARARIRSGPNPLGGLAQEDIRRARECPLPDIIGIPPRQTPRGGKQG